MQVLRSVLQHLRDCWKQNFGKKAIVPIENLYSHFPRLQNWTNIKKQFKRFQKVFWLFFASNRNISVGPMRSLETTFQKIVFIPLKRKILSVFSQIQDYCRHWVKFFWALQVFWPFIMQVLRSFLQHPRGCWKQKYFEKKGFCSKGKKTSGYFFSFSE